MGWNGEGVRNRNRTHAPLTLPSRAATSAGATFGRRLMRFFFFFMQYKIKTMMRKNNTRSITVRNRVVKTVVMLVISITSKPMTFARQITASVFKFMPAKMLSYCMGEEGEMK